MIIFLTISINPIYKIDIAYIEQFFKSSVIVRSVFAGRYRPFYQSSNIRKPSVTTRNSLGVTVRKITYYLLLTNVQNIEQIQMDNKS